MESRVSIARSLTFILLVGPTVVTAHGAMAAGDESEEWGGGRLFFQGREIAPPAELSGFGGWALFANGIQVDPLPCEWDPEPVDRWCGTDDGIPEDPWHRRLVEQDLAVERLLALSVLPLVMIGCDYLYRPEAEEAGRVLRALDAGDLEAVLRAGAPEEAVRDLRLVGKEEP